MTIGGKLVKTVPSSLNAEDLAELRMRGAAPAGPPPALPAPARAGAPRRHGDRGLPGPLTATGTPSWPGARSRSAPSSPAPGSPSGSTATSPTSSATASSPRPCPRPSPPGPAAKLRGARIADAPLPAPAPGPVSVQRKVPRDGVIMVTRQRLRVGTAHAGKIVTVHVEDTHFRVTCRRHRGLPPPPQRAAPRQPLESQDPRPESRVRVQHVLRLSTM